MNSDDKVFLALKQADAKLELALQRYQQPDVEADMRTEYLRYLRLRIRPAMDRLIREGNVRTLQELIGQIPPDESSLKMAMQVAGDSGRVLVEFGFRDLRRGSRGVLVNDHEVHVRGPSACRDFHDLHVVVS